MAKRKKEQAKVQKVTRKPRIKGSVKARTEARSNAYLSNIREMGNRLCDWESNRRAELKASGTTDTIARNLASREVRKKVKNLSL